MKLTTNYSLKKPEGSDVVNIDDFNYNADTIDAHMNGLNAHITNLISKTEAMENQINNSQNFKLTQDSGLIKEYSNGDLNNLKQTGFYKVCENVSNKPGNSTTWFFLEVLESSLGSVYQKSVNDTNGEIFTRVHFMGAWTGWKKLNTDGQQHKLTEDNGYCKPLKDINLNDISDTGFYSAQSNVSNKPYNLTNWFIVEIIDNGYGRVMQKAYDDTTGELYIRLKIDGTWNNWSKVSSYSTLSEVENKISILESENQVLREELTQIQTSIASLTSLIATTLKEK